MAEGLRLDKWLWYARLVKTRSLAAKLCVAGAVTRDQVALLKPSCLVRIGERLSVSYGAVCRVVEISAYGTRRGPAEEARGLYHEIAVQSLVRVEPHWISLFEPSALDQEDDHAC